MGKTLTNFAIALGIITVAFAGYYFYTQDGNIISTERNDQVISDMRIRTNAFIEHRKVLDKTKLDISVLEDQKFRSLRSYTTPVQEQPIGRSDPFADTRFNSSVNP